jgi:hypothetical protein
MWSLTPYTLLFYSLGMNDIISLDYRFYSDLSKINLKPS